MPFTAIYEARGRRLIYVGTRHEVSRRSATFRAIDRAFAQRPQGVLVEGFPSSWGVNPERVLAPVRAAYFNPNAADSYVRGDPGYTMQHAIGRRIPIYGGEPDGADVDRALMQQGFNPTEVASVKMLQALPQGEIAGEFRDNRDPRFRAFLDREAARIARDYTFGLIFSREIYEHWHQREFGVSVYEDRDYVRRLDPTRPGRAAEISRAMTLVRDRHIFGEIMRLTARYERSLVVYGGGHLQTQWRALWAAMGRPRIV
ncbi:MAG: hypothetical protein AB7J28_07240 [Hyphomonadaceae bacterium]